MRARLLPLTLSAAAAAGLAAAAPAAAVAAESGFVEICTSRGSSWVKLPRQADGPAAPDRGGDQAGCAHALCPRGSGPDRKKAGRTA